MATESLSTIHQSQLETSTVTGLGRISVYNPPTVAEMSAIIERARLQTGYRTYAQMYAEQHPLNGNDNLPVEP
jgi:hypothetical protein